MKFPRNTHERSVLAGIKGVFQVLGAIIASLIPLPLAGNMDEALGVSVPIIVVLSILFLVIFLLHVPVRSVPTVRLNVNSSYVPAERLNLKSTVFALLFSQTLFNNRNYKGERNVKKAICKASIDTDKDRIRIGA